MAEELKPIIAKQWMLDHWDMYDIGMKSRQQMLELLNILQANGTCFENVYEEWQNSSGYTNILGYCGTWNTPEELFKTIMDTNSFFTEEEFIDFMIEMYQNLKEDGFDDPAEEIRNWTYEGLPTDTVIWKTEDGYVRRVYC